MGDNEELRNCWRKKKMSMKIFNEKAHQGRSDN